MLRFLSISIALMGLHQREGRNLKAFLHHFLFTHWRCRRVALCRSGSRSSACAVCSAVRVQRCVRTEGGALALPKPGRPAGCWGGWWPVSSVFLDTSAPLRWEHSPVLVEGGDLSDDDVTVEHTQENLHLPEQQVALPLGDLAHWDLQHQLHQVPLPRVWQEQTQVSVQDF